MGNIKLNLEKTEKELKEKETTVNPEKDIPQEMIEEYNVKSADNSKALKIIVIVFACVAALIIAAKILFPTSHVDGQSMEPSLHHGNIVLGVCTFIHKDIELDDIVAFKNDKTNGKYYVKRIVGVPGDTLSAENGKLVRNGTVVEDSFDLMEEPGCLEEGVTLKDNEYFALGDNRNHSHDSRKIGPVNFSDIWCVLVGHKNK